jgi:hypothetical protein
LNLPEDAGKFKRNTLYYVDILKNGPFWAKDGIYEPDTICSHKISSGDNIL